MRAKDLWPQIEEFHAYNQARNLSKDTLRNYSQTLSRFREWIEANGGPPTEIDARLIRRFIAERLESGLAPNTVRAYFITLKALFAFLVMDGVLEEQDNPTRHVKAPRVPPPEIYPLTPDEVQRVLAYFDPSDFEEHRNRAAVLIMLDTGLRVGECAKVMIENIDLDQARIAVRGKGGKVRSVYFGQKMKTALGDYLEARARYCRQRWPGKTVTALFPAVSRRSPGVALARNHMSRVVMEAFDAVNIKRCFSSAHRLRHTFATSFLRAGGNLLALQRCLGHASLEMTQRYVTFLEADLRRAAIEYSPVDRLDF